MGAGTGTQNANLLERTFASKCVLPETEVNEVSQANPPHFVNGFLRIRARDVLRVLKKFREDSATGPDKSATIFLKSYAVALALSLALLAKRIVETHRWLQIWTAH